MVRGLLCIPPLRKASQWVTRVVFLLRQGKGAIDRAVCLGQYVSHDGLSSIVMFVTCDGVWLASAAFLAIGTTKARPAWIVNARGTTLRLQETVGTERVCGLVSSLTRYDTRRRCYAQQSLVLLVLD